MNCKPIRLVSEDSRLALHLRNLCLVVALTAVPVFAQWTPQQSGTTASLRGLSAASASVVWASGTGGTFLRTTDGGATWQKGTVPGAEKLDFRDVQAVDESTAYLLSIGPGDNSRIYKTTDAGQHWALQFTNPKPKGFYDCFAFWDAQHGIAVGDEVEGELEIIGTDDGGARWVPLNPKKPLPPAQKGEGAFAASGTCVAVAEKKYAWIATSKYARVFRTSDMGRTWSVADSPMLAGADAGGIFSIAAVDRDRLIAVGGDYTKPAATAQTAAHSEDGGKTWTLSSKLPSGFRSAVAIVPDTPGPTAIAVGTTGIDYSLDHGRSWTHMEDANLNAVAFADAHNGWAVGPKGTILKFEGTAPGGLAPSLKK